ncbi:MAG: histidine kinase [Butyricicoccaceae bacterium]
MKLGFRFRMMLAILTVAFVCVIAVSLTNYYDSKRMIEQNYVTSLDDKMTLQLDRFDEIMQGMYQNVRYISHQTELIQQIEKYLDSSRSYDDGIKVSHTLNSMLSDTMLAVNQLDGALYLYLPETDQVFSSMEYYAVRELEDGDTLPWQNGSEDPFTPIFCVNRFARSSQRVYAYTSPVYDAAGEAAGILCITVDERQMYYGLLDSLNNLTTETYRLLTPDGTICSAKATSEIGGQVAGLSEQHTKQMNANTEGGHLLFASVQASFSGYRLMCQSDLSILTKDLRARQLSQVIYVLMIFFFLMLAAALLSKRLSQPVEDLICAIDQVRGGDFTARAKSRPTDEFDVLLEHFNAMVSRMDELMEQVVHERTQKKQAELNALQYQIRPHFMYNTLNSIRFAALLQRNYKLAELLSAFTSLLEASVQRKGAFITLQEEMELVQNYISLQKFRYLDCFEADYQIDPQTEECYVPCLLLQPMVENAVFHGIDAKKSDNRIEIAAWLEHDRLYITVKDNGAGISEQAQETDGTLTDKRRLTGIGLRNVEQRLRLYYGENAHFVLSSKPNQGTTVQFDLPISHDPDEYKI